MSEQMKAKLLDILKTGAWIGGSALLAFVLGELAKMPELVAYAGLINFVLYALNEARKK